jgi:predicted amino acid dehydrogenase
MAPFLPEHLVTWGENEVVRKVVKAARLAERLNANIVALGGFASIAGDEGREVSNHLKVPVTSGNSYTAAMVLRGMRQAAALVGVALSDSTVAIIGATGDIGSACARVLANEAKQLNLAARNERKLNEFSTVLRQAGRASIRVDKYIRDTVRDADLILSATSSITTLIEADDVKSGAIICDVAIPHNVAASLLRSRSDVLAFEGGLAKLPNGSIGHTGRATYLSDDGETVYGCLAEAIILALEDRNESYSLGRGYITPSRINEIEVMGDRHGFELARFRYNGKYITEERINFIRKIIEARKKNQYIAVRSE